MRATRALLLAAFVATAGCQLPFGSGSDAGTSDDAGTTTGNDAGTASTTPTSADPLGANCTAIAPGTTLCQAISLCPSFLLDSTLFPHCGFRMKGSVLDLECYCDGALCPIGVPASCDQIPALLDGQTEDTVCVQQNLGRCISVTSGTTGTGGAGTTSGTCDATCRSECGGDPNCITQCGC